MQVNASVLFLRTGLWLLTFCVEMRLVLLDVAEAEALARLQAVGRPERGRRARKGNWKMAMWPRANPTTSIYNASAVKIYNATNSLARFWNKNYFHPM
jgi:muconolactone delta-isomerase